MKLKKILEESNAPGFKDRKFGDALPTMASVKAAYDAKNGITEVELTEAPMDKRFMKDWEKSCRALVNHLGHEIKKGKGEIGQTNLSMLKKMQSHVEEAMQIPSKMDKIVGEQ